jgi:hypothetical protein
VVEVVVMNTLQIALVTSAIRARVNELLADDPDADEAALLRIVDTEVPHVDDVVRALVFAIQDAEIMESGCEQRIQFLKARKARHTRKIDTYRGLLFNVMEAAGQTKWTAPEFTASLSPGRPGVVITDEAALPDAFVLVERKPDKALIKSALDSNLPVPGATISNGLPTLTVRTK